MIFYKILIVLLILNSCVPKKIDQINNTELIENDNNVNFIKYVVEEPYEINGIKYIPREDYNYSEIGYAKVFNKSHHGKKTKNNEILNIAELIAAHKTLPLPSVVKVTNLENNIALILRVNDRGPLNNDDIIMVSIKAAKLLGINNINKSKVKVEILEKESIQLKTVSQSVTNESSLQTITAAPTEEVTIESIDKN